jgi:MoxR-like ATPase
MHYDRRRRYGETHIRARLEQMDDLLGRIADYTLELAAHQADLQRYATRSVWLDASLVQKAQHHLAATHAAVTQLAQRAADLREGFEQLPRLPVDNARVPEPVPHEPLDVV